MIYYGFHTKTNELKHHPTNRTSSKSHNFFAVAILFLMFLFLVSCSTKNSKTITNFTAMDTFMTIQSYGKNSRKANELAKKKVLELENLLSVTNAQSEVYFLNHNQQKWHTVNPETYEIINFSFQMAQFTDGAFNPCLYPVLKEWGFTTENFKIPSKKLIEQLLPFTDFTKLELNKEETAVFFPEEMMIDLGGIGKGFAGDKVLEILKENGITSAILDFGGNIQTLGKKPDGSEWKIGIKNPLTKEIAASVQVDNMSVITSGGYERNFTGQDGKQYIHILDSRTGFPVDNDLASVTIICPEGKYADALSTAVFAMGLEKAKIFCQTNQTFEMLLFTKDGETYLSDGLHKKVIFLEPEKQ